ncbi:MAG: alpha-ketoacid dehydrogenase subunit beta [Gemmatimonadaceae bacterium]
MASEPVVRTYGAAIRDGFAYLLHNYPETFVIGQGLWSPWYVGNSMTNLEIEFGRSRVIDSPVSELMCTGAAVGAAIAGRRPIVVHPRMDFMLLAVDQIVTQAAKWSSMFGARVAAPVVIRGIINRGGEQGAQHSQALHSWFAHIPGLRVAMPATPVDARDLLVSAALCGDPVLYIDDRWLYERSEEMPATPNHNAIFTGPTVTRPGDDVTVVGAGHAAYLAEQVAERLGGDDVSAEVIDLRVINPLDSSVICASVERTGRLLVIDGGWTSCGLAGELMASVVERLDPSALRVRPRRLTLRDAPAPTSRALEAGYYPSVERAVDLVREMLLSPARAM